MFPNKFFMWPQTNIYPRTHTTNLIISCIELIIFSHHMMNWEYIFYLVFQFFDFDFWISILFPKPFIFHSRWLFIFYFFYLPHFFFNVHFRVSLLSPPFPPLMSPAPSPCHGGKQSSMPKAQVINEVLICPKSWCGAPLPTFVPVVPRLCRRASRETGFEGWEGLQGWTRGPMGGQRAEALLEDQVQAQNWTILRGEGSWDHLNP
jgi:hypothetical protein